MHSASYGAWRKEFLSLMHPDAHFVALLLRASCLLATQSHKKERSKKKAEQSVKEPTVESFKASMNKMKKKASKQKQGDTGSGECTGSDSPLTRWCLASKLISNGHALLSLCAGTMMADVDVASRTSSQSPSRSFNSRVSSSDNDEEVEERKEAAAGGAAAAGESAEMAQTTSSLSGMSVAGPLVTTSHTVGSKHIQAAPPPPPPQFVAPAQRSFETKPKPIRSAKEVMQGMLAQLKKEDPKQ